jgi:hypothetical protein
VWGGAKKGGNPPHAHPYLYLTIILSLLSLSLHDDFSFCCHKKYRTYFAFHLSFSTFLFLFLKNTVLIPGIRSFWEDVESGLSERKSFLFNFH